MLIQIIRGELTYNRKTYAKGSVVDVEDSEAERLIKIKIAEIVETTEEVPMLPDDEGEILTEDELKVITDELSLLELDSESVTKLIMAGIQSIEQFVNSTDKVLKEILSLKDVKAVRAKARGFLTK